MKPAEWKRDGFLVSTDPALLDFEVIHGYLSRSYWSPEIPRALVEKAARNSLAFGVYREGAQVGFARVISDYATFAYLSDVFILEEARGHGLSKWLVECILAHPELQGLRRFALATKDAHGLYSRYGFKEPDPGKWMEIVVKDLYRRKS